MAKKKKEKDSLSYLQMPIPQAQKSYGYSKSNWSGLNKRYTKDTGVLSMESNISTAEAPCLTPSQKLIEIKKYDAPVGMFGFDNFLIVIYNKDKQILLDYITFDESWDIADTYTGIVKSEDADTDNQQTQRSMVQFNVYSSNTDVLEGSYIKKLLLFPDKKVMDFRIVSIDDEPTSDMDTNVMYFGKEKYWVWNGTSFVPSGSEKNNNYFVLEDLDVEVKEFTAAQGEKPPEGYRKDCYWYNAEENEAWRWVDGDTEDTTGWEICTIPNFPNIQYATVHLSRLFGVDDARVYVSGFNDYTNWNLDTIDESNESNAWCSAAQSNTKSSGEFTGITTFQNHVVCFKKDFMHEIYNTKNPFRIQDIYADGSIDNRSIQEVNGQLIFISDNDVKVYTGSKPRVIGNPLGINVFNEAVAGTDGRNYYLYCRGDYKRYSHLFVYDTFVGQWSERAIDNRVSGVLSFAHNDIGMFMLTGEGQIYRLDSGEYDHKWSCETDLSTALTSSSRSIDIKHIRKIQLLADIAEGSSLQIYALYDGEKFDPDTSHLLYENRTWGMLPIRIKPRKTANYAFKLHFEGYGYVKLYDLEIHLNAGGELFA